MVLAMVLLCAARASALAASFRVLRSPGTSRSEMDSTGVPTIGVADCWGELDFGGRSRFRVKEDVAGVAGAFVVRDVLSRGECARLVAAAEGCGLMDTFDAGKNRHGALQVAAEPDGLLVGELGDRLAPHVPREVEGRRFADRLNARLRFYRYAADGAQEFRPHVDAGFPASGCDGDVLVMDAHDGRAACGSSVDGSRRRRGGGRGYSMEASRGDVDILS